MFRSIDFIGTVTDPRTHPLLALGEVVHFRDERSGSPAGGGLYETFRNAYTDPLHGELKHLTETAGTWRVAGDQTNESAGIRMPFDPGGGLSEMFGAWPYGAHGGGHPEGHPGIDFELDGSAVILAVRSGTITEIRDNWLTPDQVNIVLDCGELDIQYSHVDADLAAGVVEGATVTAGQPLGWPGAYCCDPVKCCEREGCVPGEEATCCGTHYPEMGDCDLDTNPDYHHLIHFGVNGVVDEECPYDVMNDVARTELETLFLTSHYAEEFTEPFLCNDGEHRADAMSYVTHWEKFTAVSTDNPATVVIDRGLVYGDPDYRFLDGTGAELHAGILCANQPPQPTSAEFIENGTTCFGGEPGTVSHYATFDITGEGHAAVMTLDVGGSGTDTYQARIVDDPPPPCAPVAGTVGDLRLSKQGPGVTLGFVWSPPPVAEDFVLFESGAPDGDFMVPVDVTATGNLSVPMPGATRFYHVVVRNASCGLDRPLP